MEPILLFTGASANTLEYAVDYLSIYLLGTIFVEISTGLNSFINAQGRPAIAMFSVLIGALLNIILDPIFIFGFNMGVKGEQGYVSVDRNPLLCLTAKKISPVGRNFKDTIQ
jgi:Na+-driven multidrug efflux pump